MTISSFVARPLLAGMFIYGGLDAFKNPSGKTPRAEKVAPTIADVVGIDADTEQLVQLNGAVQVRLRGEVRETNPREHLGT